MSTNTLTVAEIIKDKSKGASKIAGIKGLEVLRTLTEADHRDLVAAYEGYDPKSPVGQGLKASVLANLETLISEAGAGEAAKAVEEMTQPTPEKSSLSGDAKAQMIKSATECFFIKVAQPAFTACIDAEEWANKDRIQAGAVVPDPEGQGELDLDPDAPTPESEIDKKRHFVVQKLYGKDFLRPLNSNRLEFFAWVKRHAVPARLMAPHHYLVPNGLSNDVITRIQQLIEDRNKLLDAFEARYQEAKDDAKKRLGIHYDAARYPDFVDVRAKFTVDYRIRSLDPAASLKEINKAEWDRQTAFAKEDYENTFEIVRVGIREGFVDLIATFADALGNDEAGKPKVFHGSKVEKLKDFLGTFEARDLTKDGELSALAAQAKALLADVDPKGLRKDVDSRASLKAAFAKIGEQASELVVVRGRKLDLDDED